MTRMGRISFNEAAGSWSIASTHGTIGFAQRPTDGISKAGFIHMTRMLRTMGGARHPVNAVAPCTVRPAPARNIQGQPGRRAAMVNGCRCPFGRPSNCRRSALLASPEAVVT